MLPALRDNICVHEGPTNHAGAPSWTIHDPTRNSFFRIDWLTYEIIARWSLGDAEAIAENLNAQLPLHATADTVGEVAKFLADQELIRFDFPGSSELLGRRFRQRELSWWQWLLHHYLFVRLPLVKPDALLGRTLPYVRWLASRWFFRITLCAFAFGLWEVMQQWDQLRATFIDTLTPEGAVSYAVTLALVKAAHELGHAYTAKAYGCRVPTMGVALLVMLPVAYTDTTETWKLADRRQRLKVAYAGVATELAIAVWATAALPLAPPGPLHMGLFLVATTTWVRAVAANFNPLMRYDGYFILSDLLDIPNLHDRAFALARWRLRRWVLGLDVPPPESFPRTTQLILLGLAFVTWIYRLGLYLGVAFLVYHFTIKLVGILLFGIEMSWFVLRPFVSEFKQWRALAPGWAAKRRWRVSAALLAGAALLAFAPLPSPIVATALLSPRDLHVFYAPESGRLTELKTAVGAPLAAGEVVVAIQAPNLDNQERLAAAQVDTLRNQAAAAAVDPDQRDRLLQLQTQLSAAEAALQASSQQAGRLELKAPYAGKLSDIAPDLKVGEWVRKGGLIGSMTGPAQGWQAIAYLPSDAVRRIHVGSRARFTLDGGSGDSLGMVVDAIDVDATRSLDSAIFSAPAGGDVAVRASRNKLTPDAPVYRVHLTGEAAPAGLAGHSWRGRVRLTGGLASPGLNFLRNAVAVLIREAGF